MRDSRISMSVETFELLTSGYSGRQKLLLEIQARLPYLGLTVADLTRDIAAVMDPQGAA